MQDINEGSDPRILAEELAKHNINMKDLYYQFVDYLMGGKSDEPLVDARKFVCGGCGECCRKVVRVNLNIMDIVNMSDFLGMEYGDFIKKYLRVEGYIDDKSVKTLALKTKPCPFFKENKCTIYPVRPAMCRLFPFKDARAMYVAEIVDVIAFPNCSAGNYEPQAMVYLDRPAIVDDMLGMQLLNLYVNNYYTMDGYDRDTFLMHYQEALRHLKDIVMGNERMIRLGLYNMETRERLDREDSAGITVGNVTWDKIKNMVQNKK